MSPRLPTLAVDALVVGAGAVGLATARALAACGRDTLLLDGAPGAGTATSSRSSEVAHAGIYYPPSSLKARTCVAGRAALADYCASRGVPFSEVGKLIVAPSPTSLPRLAALAANAAACGVSLTPLSPSEAAALEPRLGPVAGALLSPGTAIFDTHAYCAALLGDVEAAGGTFAARATVVGGRTVEGGGIEVDVCQGGGEEGDATTPTLRVRARTAVLAAGLGSNRLLARVAGLAGGGALSRQRVAAGRYCRLAAWPAAAPPPFSRLIYPLPVDGGLGVHATLDLGGGTRFGPDVDWWCAEEEERGSGGGADALGPAPPDVPATIVPAFEASVRAWWPGLPPGSLAPDYAGLRPKLGGPGDAPSDFLVAGRAVHGAAGVVVLLGVESPGLTASLALADVAVAALDE